MTKKWNVYSFYTSNKDILQKQNKTKTVGNIMIGDLVAVNQFLLNIFVWHFVRNL